MQGIQTSSEPSVLLDIQEAMKEMTTTSAVTVLQACFTYSKAHNDSNTRVGEVCEVYSRAGVLWVRIN